jgi:hypothetical protein|tara:strand:+ start:1157 stop:1483 length:327 start_codon:yes stop_codon:yes gene_type:complete
MFNTCKITTNKNTAATLAAAARPGTARAQRWAILATMGGQTVAAYYAKCRAAGCPVSSNNPIRAAALGAITLTLPNGTNWATANPAMLAKHAPASIRKAMLAKAAAAK